MSNHRALAVIILALIAFVGWLVGIRLMFPPGDTRSFLLFGGSLVLGVLVGRVIAPWFWEKIP